MSDSLRIGDLVRHTRCPAESIRYYEREGLLPPPLRSAGNYRLYGRAHVERLIFIRHCRALDMTLDEIRQLLQVRDNPQGNCEAAHALLDEHVAHVSARIGELRRLEKELKALRRSCLPAGNEAICGILVELGHDAAPGAARKSRAHVHGTH